MNIRPETPADRAMIQQITTAAFADAPHSDGSEAALIDQLRATDGLSLSLVAETNAGIVGHVAFSQVTISDGTQGWFGLAPVSVSPLQQGTGIGSHLIRTGLDLLCQRGAAGCVVLGDPAYYTRFGFQPDAELRFPEAPAQYFMQHRFSGSSPRGIVTYHPAFYPGAAKD